MALNGGDVPGPDGANANPYLYKVTVKRGAVVEAVSAFGGRAGSQPKRSSGSTNALTIICQERAAGAAVTYFRATGIGTVGIGAEEQVDMEHCTFCPSVAVSFAQIKVT